MSNSLDPDQARRIVGPDLGPNCLPRLSADDTGRQRVKVPNTRLAELANTVDPDETAHYEPSHLDLQCLPSSLCTFNIINF